MIHYVAVYDRSEQHLVKLLSFVERADALQRRWTEEAAAADDENIEVVLLSASSEDALRLTHARYFNTSEELASGF